MMAEIIGLSFFALLLSEITTVYSIIGSNQSKFYGRKNAIIQFIQYAPHHHAL